jgi:3-oxoacyl-[acyl-carrier-protein] synthase II
MNGRRVVITGLGIVSPVGNTISEAWKNVVEGISGIGLIDAFDTSQFTTRFGGVIRNFQVEDYVSAKEARKIDPFMHYGIAACSQALADSGLEVSDANRHRIGVNMGSGIGGIGTIEANHAKYAEAGLPRKISPFFVPGSIINMISGHVSILHGLKGPNLALVTACTTATHSIGIAGRMIAYGDADAMLAGGAEHATTPLGLGGFCSMRALSTRNDDPTAASRPWDRGRDGFVLSDGAGALLLEEYEHARARGATIYGELIGFGMSGDAHHITAPPDDGEGARAAMQAAITDARVALEDIGYVNAHGTSTPLGDIAETTAIRQVFGDLANRVPVSSTKSTTGHLLGAAGGVEAIFTVLALRDQVIPPTINLDDPDPRCDLDYVPGKARQARLDVAISNSFGFGGTNGSLVFRRAN